MEMTLDYFIPIFFNSFYFHDLFYCLLLFIMFVSW